MKKIELTRTQLFLRFLKKHNIYNSYLKEIHEIGRDRLRQAIQESAHYKTNDILSFINFCVNEMLWTEMMSWSNKTDYNNNNHTQLFWSDIDHIWTTIWPQVRDRYKGYDSVVDVSKIANDIF